MWKERVIPSRGWDGKALHSHSTREFSGNAWERGCDGLESWCWDMRRKKRRARTSIACQGGDLPGWDLIWDLPP